MTQLSRSQAAPAVEVARAMDPPGRRRAATTISRPPAPSAAAPATPSRTWSPASTPRALAALTPRHGGGRPADLRPGSTPSGSSPRRPEPDARGRRHRDLVARDLRKACAPRPDGLPEVSTYTIRRVLRESGASYQRTRTWCPTGKALRRRKAGPAVVADPDSDAKKS